MDLLTIFKEEWIYEYKCSKSDDRNSGCVSE